MKRSEINRTLEEAKVFFAEMKFALPAWAFRSPAEWRGKAAEAAEIVKVGLGWDVTDFGSGAFDEVGLTNFNLRNGIPGQGPKVYCEKLLLVKENQVTPLHTHRSKVEDIINRGGGNLVIELIQGDDALNLTDKPVTVKIDSIERTVPAGGTVILTPGESICLVPGVFHKFYGEEGAGWVLVGEVSTVNDDTKDNVFVDGSPRFPMIEEDEAPTWLLVNDYGKYL